MPPLAANLGKPYTGLTGTVGYRLLGVTGAVVQARATAGIAELVSGSGLYAVSAPESAAIWVVWDTGGGTPKYAIDAVPGTRIVEPAAGGAPDFTEDGILRILLAGDAGVTDGMETSTATIQNPAGTIDRVVATTDTDGNRTPTDWDGSV